MARPGGARRRGCPTNRGTGPWRAAAFAGADWGRGTWICVLSKRRPTWLPSAGATPQTSAPKRSDFHLAQPEKVHLKKIIIFADTCTDIRKHAKTDPIFQRDKTISHRGFMGPARSQGDDMDADANLLAVSTVATLVSVRLALAE